MKRITAALLVLTLCLSTLMGCGARVREQAQARAAQDSENAAASRDPQIEALMQGELYGHTYRLPGIEMYIWLPQEFTVTTGDALDEQIAPGASALYRFLARTETETVTLIVQEDSRSPEEYLEAATEKLSGGQNEVGAIEDVTIAGFDCKLLRNKTKNPAGLDMVELNLIYGQEGVLYGIGALWPAEREDDARDMLEKMIGYTGYDMEDKPEVTFTEAEIEAGKLTVLAYAAENGFAVENLTYDGTRHNQMLSSEWIDELRRDLRIARTDVLILLGDAVFDESTKPGWMFILYRENADSAWVLAHGNMGY